MGGAESVRVGSRSVCGLGSRTSRRRGGRTVGKAPFIVPGAMSMRGLGVSVHGIHCVLIDIACLLS